MSNYSNQDKILEILHNDCRLPLEEISVMTGIAAQEVAAIIDDLERRYYFRLWR